MAGNGAFHQNEVLIRENLHHFEVADFHAGAAITTTHSHTLEYLRRIRTGADRTWSATAVVLTVCLAANTAKAVAFHNTLKTFAF